MTERTTDATAVTCPFGELVERRILGAVSDEERLRLEAHLAQGCPSCAPLVSEQDHLERLIQGAFRPLEHEIERRRGVVVDRVKEAVAREDARNQDRRRRRVGVNAILFFIVLTGTIMIAAAYVMTAAYYRSRVALAKREQARAEVNALVVALFRYRREHQNELPLDTIQLGVSLGEKRSGSDRAYYTPDATSLRDGAILDPWGHPYVYERRTDGALVWSHGPTGKATANDADAIVCPLVVVPK
jgi:hypothetical protein